MGGFAWVTLATNDSYSLGALVLAHSLRRVGTKHDLAVLITPGVTQPMREKLSSVFSLVQEVNVLDSRDEANLALLARPELGITFTKLHCWRLTQYDKCVFVDADTLVIRNCDELFEREELSAAPDVGWPDCFNSGVFVFTPSQQTFASLTAFAASQGSFDGGDQGLLNLYFSDWPHKDISKHLPFIYNMCSTATYSYLPAYKQFGDDVRIIHFIGTTKPWLQYYDTVTRQVQPAPGMNHLQPLLQLWWNIFCDNVHPELSPIMASTTLAPHWHEILLPSPSIPLNTTHHIVHDSTDRTCDEIDRVEFHFSEFQDPWENFLTPTCYDTQSHSHQSGIQIASTPVNNEIYQANSQTDYYQHSPSVYIQHHQPEREEDKSENSPGSIITHSSQSQNYSHYDCRHTQPSTQTSQSEYQIHQQYPHPSVQSQNQSRSDTPSSVNSQSNQSSTQYHRDANFQHQEQIYHVNIPDSQIHDVQKHSDITRDTERLIHQESNFNETSPDNNSHCSMSDRLTDGSRINSNLQTEVNTSPSHFPTCTESKSISTHSNLNTTGDINNSDSGIAGALAQLTLGEARSPEQIALEEHMRKCGWEQGQIDYMGRDSFDNIWKKICGTLDAAPQARRDKTPPKEKTPPLEREQSPGLTTSKAATATTEKEAAAAEEAAPEKSDVITEFQQEKLNQQITSENILEAKQQEMTQITEQTTTKNVHTQISLEEAKEPPSIPITQQPSSGKSPDILRITAAPPLLSLTSSPPILALTSSPPILSIKEAGEKYQELKTRPAAAPASEEIETQEKPRETVIPLGFISPTTYETTTSLDLSASEIRVETESSQTAAADSSVPIQVAESILEADIKESVSEDIKPVTEEAISSISAPIQESVSAIVETLEPAVPVQAPPPLETVVAQSNGTGGFDSDFKSDGECPISPVSERVMPAAEEPERVLSAEISQSAPVPEVAPVERQSEAVSEVCPEVPKELLAETTQPQSQSAAPDTVAAEAAVPRVPEECKESSAPVVISPEKFEIPGTPTVTEATPPTSPQFELAESQQEKGKSHPKGGKKAMKKTSSDEKTESSEADEVKKTTKKVVKKVVKKPKEGQAEGAEGSTSAEKPKKVVKVIKKTPKTDETLSTDSSVPETPPPSSSSSETPVPPKRKTKPGTTKTAAKKPESEQ